MILSFSDNKTHSHLFSATFSEYLNAGYWLDGLTVPATSMHMYIFFSVFSIDPISPNGSGILHYWQTRLCLEYVGLLTQLLKHGYWQPDAS